MAMINPNVGPIYDRSALVSKYDSKRMRFGVKQQDNINSQDSASFSSTGKRLNLVITDHAPAQANGNQWKPITDSSMHRIPKLLDKHIVKAGELLEEMKTIAIAAQEEALSDQDRVVMQMEIGRLQHELDIYSDSMVWNYSSSASQTDRYARSRRGEYENTDSYKMLERTLERITNGEKWDVAEVKNYLVLPCTVNGVDRLLAVDSEWEIVKDATTPTVGEILKGKGRSLMDAESAVVSAQELEQNVEDLKKQRSELEKFVEKAGGVIDETNEDTLTPKVNSLFERLSSFFNTLYRESAQVTIGDYEKPADPTKTYEIYLFGHMYTLHGTPERGPSGPVEIEEGMNCFDLPKYI